MFFLQGSDIPKVTSDEKLVLEAGQVVLVFIVMGGMFGIGKEQFTGLNTTRI